MELILVRGMPGSGKSTLAGLLAREAEDNGSIVLEADQFFTHEDGTYLFDINRIGAAHQWCRDETVRNLEMEYRVVVANTFTTMNELRPYFQIAKDFEITPSVILCQNQWGSIHDVPQATILNMQKRFQYNIDELFKEFA